ncbi:ATP-binding response regulator [Methylobacter sp.]|uniref:ATP-binding response regulator n=1 Tax=Methylobacter sp. TaxID=2051955 RepID=UPI002FDCC073
MLKKQLIFLIVDDFDSMRNVINSLLRSLGYENILTAKDGAEALRILRSQTVNVVLSDWDMPVMDGLALLKEVRADERLQKLPFLMITDKTDRQRIEEAINNGASDLLIRPYTGRDLVRRIEKVLSWRPREISATLEPVEQKKSTRPTILVVDDMPDNLSILSNLFKNEYRVRIADNGEKTLAICQSDDPPDLVLLDIMMPGIDGFEVARRMRNHSGSEHIPVIFVTAINNDDVRLKGLELGAIDFVAKPINPAVLKPRVRNFLRYVEAHKQLQADYDSMQELARLRDDVKNIIRYDTKTPLSEVIGLVQDLADDVTLDPAQADKLQTVEETSLQMLNMINLSTELYKIETGIFKLNAQPVNVYKILRCLVEISRKAYADKQLTVTMSIIDIMMQGQEAPKSLGDAMLCYTLFNNLIRNACEAAPTKSIVLISLLNEDPMQVTIQNRGVVPVNIRESFFDKFIAQEKSADIRMGFYSAKLLAEAQNGKIALDVSDEKNLTLVSVSLPRFSST